MTHALHVVRTLPRRRVVAVAVALAAALGLAYAVVHGPVRHVVVAGDSMLPTFRSGDVVVTVRRDGYDVGDVVAYRIPDGEPGAGVLVIHRIVARSEGRYVLQGDNKRGRDPWQPTNADVRGEAVVRVPFVGLALGFLRTPLGFALIAGVVAFALALGPKQR